MCVRERERECVCERERESVCVRERETERENDWRLWVEAVKSENESWNTFDACEEIPYDNIISGASVIPLGELFTIKRNGKYKFRQIALGNMLKEGKDYGETFASTISGDGLR